MEGTVRLFDRKNGGIMRGVGEDQYFCPEKMIDKGFDSLQSFWG